MAMGAACVLCMWVSGKAFSLRKASSNMQNIYMYMHIYTQIFHLEQSEKPGKPCIPETASISSRGESTTLF